MTYVMRVRPLVLSVVYGWLLTLTGCGSGSSRPSSPPPPQIRSAKLTVNLTGSGTATSTPAGINCPSTCTADFNSATTVTLSAAPASGFNFSGFTGACSGTSCQITLSAGENVSVTVTFAQAPPQRDITAINHIIVLLQENRSFDHYFSHLPDYWTKNNFPQATNGTTFDVESPNASNLDPQGNAVVPYNLQSACTENPSPSWNESHVDRNWSDSMNGTLAPMDGFVHTAAGDASGFGLYDVLGHRTMGYFNGDQLNYYYFMASSFGTSDAWFSPVLSRTHPNRMYLYAATSAGHVYPLSTSSSQPLPNQTIFQLLQDHGVSWKIYVHPDSTGCTSPSCLAPYSYLNQFTYYQEVLKDMPKQFVSTTQLLSDMQNGTLPQVSFVEPAGYVGLDEHATDKDVLNAPNVQSAAAYVQNIVDTLMGSPSWNDSLFVLTYDEGGGFYDHMAPQTATPPDAVEFPTDIPSGDICDSNTSSPVCGFFVTGFRVPVIVISPFTKKNYVSHAAMDYTAILKLIETRFKLPSLTVRDAAQPDMAREFLDVVDAPWMTPPSPPKQARTLPCILETLNAVTITPNPALAGGQATVTLSLAKAAIQDVTIELSSNPTALVPPSASIANGSSSTTITVNVPTGITSLTITGTIGGIPVSGSVSVQ
jgi:phospholipase C